MKPFSYILVVSVATVLAGCNSTAVRQEQEREYIQAANEQFERADAGGNDHLVGVAKDMVESAKIIFPDEDAAVETAKKEGKKITFPRIISAPRPSYPLMSQITHAEGDIWVAFIVGVSGNVDQAKALEDPDSAISQAALKAVKKWKFIPGRIDELRPKCCSRFPSVSRCYSKIQQASFFDSKISLNNALSSIVIKYNKHCASIFGCLAVAANGVEAVQNKGSIWSAWLEIRS